MIAAVSTTYNEVDLIAKTISHLLGNGIERIWVADASDDGTKEVLASFPEVTVVNDTEDHHFQPRWINALTDDAREAGADWVIPFDADEFWYAQDGRTIAEALADLPESTAVCVAAPFQHVDWEMRHPDHAAMSKMAFRPQPGAEVVNGNHRVVGYDGDLNFECLAIREIMFRGLEHLNVKCRARVDRIDPSLDEGDGHHQRVLAAMDDAGRAADWAERLAAATVHDPIPYRGKPVCPRCGEVMGPGHESYPCVRRIG